MLPIIPGYIELDTGEGLSLIVTVSEGLLTGRLSVESSSWPHGGQLARTAGEDVLPY